MAVLQPQPTNSFDSELFERRIREYAAEHPRTVRILEAGCGRRWTINLDGVDFHLTGVDLDDKSMRARIEFGDLDEAIVGDLRTVPVEPESFDVAFCSFLLEHVEGAELVLDRVFAALKPGGLFLLRIPDRDSVYGFFTRHSPFWLHVQYKRHMRGARMAGTPGHGPYPTVYDRVVSWRGMSDYCAAHNLEITDAYSSNFYLKKLHRFAGPTNLSLRAVSKLSRGRLSADHNNIAFVIRKPG